MLIIEDALHGSTKNNFLYNGPTGHSRHLRWNYANSSKDYDLVSRQISPMDRHTLEKLP